MKLKERIRYWKDIKNGTRIPIFNCNIDINKFKVKKEGSCETHFHPVIIKNLSTKQRETIYYHIGQVIDIIRNNIEDVEELK